MTPDEAYAKLTRERDLYLQLLELGTHDAPVVFLEKALSLFIEVAGARRGYIELREPSALDESPLSFARDFEDQQLSPSSFSRSVVTETFETGETVSTACALDDIRFQERGSVQANRLEAVLCAPIGSSPVIGVVYLQDRIEPGPFTSDDLQRATLFSRHVAPFAERFLARQRSSKERDATREVRTKLKLSGIVGSSEALGVALSQIAMVAPLNISVLLTGASGTGKTQFARALHENCARSSGNFVEVNCGALPENLVENELFGSAPGGHSSAQKRVIGKVEAAEGGTLFLDEIGELPLQSQAKLLQLLQSNTYYPLGASMARRANLRIVAATNVDLEAAVGRRAFREDLYYRLSVFPIRIPSLDERRSDIAALAAHFCALTCDSYRFAMLQLSPGAILALEHAEWAGNVRELGHCVQAGVVRAHGEGSSTVERRHLFVVASAAPAGRNESERRTFHEATRIFQKQLLREALLREKWNVASTARTLDLTRAHVYNLMANFGIDRPAAENEG